MNHALCPLDGRYANKARLIAKVFNESQYYRNCMIVEIKWLRTLSSSHMIPECPNHMPNQWQSLLDWAENMPIGDIESIKIIEKETKHDIKAVEYFLRKVLADRPHFKNVENFIHFGLTSEGITNVVYAKMLQQGREVISGSINEILQSLKNKSREHAELAMLSRTHGQTATPTTFGKEFANYYIRLRDQFYLFDMKKACAKINGATGNYAAMNAAYPNVNWPELTAGFLNSMNLRESTYTTQIEPHDWIAEWFHSMIRLNNILIDLCQDIWQYMSLGYLSIDTDRVGSSTMPHKVNPIEFENAEGNLQMANALLTFFADKLTKSRMQRDLSGSTVKRNLGMAFGYTQVGYLSIMSGLSKIQPNNGVIQQDLFNHPEVITEAVQTVLRKYGIKDAYEKVKEASKAPFDKTKLFKMVYALDLPLEVKDELRELTPDKYVGLAIQMTEFLEESYD